MSEFKGCIVEINFMLYVTSYKSRKLNCTKYMGLKIT